MARVNKATVWARWESAKRHHPESATGELTMATRVRWLGHACLLVESDGKRLLMDPFFTGNPAAPIKAEEAAADFIIVSHGHGDHVGDAVEIAKRTGATVIANY